MKGKLCRVHENHERRLGILAKDEILVKILIVEAVRKQDHRAIKNIHLNHKQDEKHIKTL